MTLENLFVSTITERRIFYFSSDHLNTDEPHFFICLKITSDKLIILVCCTSQVDTINRHIEQQNLNNQTIVWINPIPETNPFNKDTYINCNWTCTYTLEEFKSMFADKKIKCDGEINEIEYEQILKGIHLSKLVENEIKEVLPIPSP